MQHRTSLVDRMLERLVPKATAMATSVCPLPSDCYYTGNRYGSACRGGYIYEVQCGPREGYSHWFQCPC